MILDEMGCTDPFNQAVGIAEEAEVIAATEDWLAQQGYDEDEIKQARRRQLLQLDEFGVFFRVLRECAQRDRGRGVYAFLGRENENDRLETPSHLL